MRKLYVIKKGNIYNKTPLVWVLSKARGNYSDSCYWVEPFNGRGGTFTVPIINLIRASTIARLLYE